MITLTLSPPPSTNALTKNNGWGLGRSKTAAYKAWIKAAGWEINLQHPNRLYGSFGVKIWVSPDLRLDIDNFIKPVVDLLVRMNIVPDDSHMESLFISRHAVAEPGKLLVEVNAE